MFYKDLFSNVGKKLKTYALINTAIGLAVGFAISIIDAVIIGLYDDGEINVVLFITGLLVVFIFHLVSLSLFALGQITDDVHYTTNQNDVSSHEIE